ncbi:MAG: hypothetical protein A4E37_00054 [Methanoregulaceae archaeon PtaB.Bin056]|nr:MAG: hypothetical protein A4E37_00054 [Methanoregulaceae archaeon PtaB.Bin056]
MVPPAMVEAAERKGLLVIGTGDALHPQWRREWEGFLSGGGPGRVIVVPSAEVEDRDRVHHLILMDGLFGFSALQKTFSLAGNEVAATGRPRLRLSGEQIARAVHDAGGLVGPAHAFTPWTSMYASHDHVAECYGGEPIDFLELGLSADSSYGAAIPDLYGVPFISSSDAHGPDPWRMGRECVVLEVREATPAGVLEAVSGGRIVQNIGLFPEEGKYNRTACSRCFRQFSSDEAAAHAWRCPADGGRIKKGVFDRARELSSGEPRPRPPYLHMIPLPEILQRVLGCSSPQARRVERLYNLFVERFGEEIRVLTEVPVQDLATVHEGAAFAIDALRCGKIRLSPGGGGRYGTFSFL